jgi:crotonobetainyl-CoA:carnitine CoA-transferase CaiB-like acyl-CoA transferase
LGIDYESLKAENPRIILASISGFGQTGPYKTRPGFDQIAQGMGGLMGVTGEPGTPPMRAGIAVADSSAGVFAATGILIALAEREKSGIGQWIHTSLLQSQISMMDFQAARYLVDHKVPPQAGNDHPARVPMGVVATADGFINIAVGGDGQWRSFCACIERPDLGADPRYAKGGDRTRLKAEVKAAIEPVLKTRTSADWLARLEAANVPAGPIYTLDEVFADPQVEHLGIAVPVKDSERGDIRVVGQPITMSRTPAGVLASVPEVGEHNDEILREFGYSAGDIAELRKDKVI